MGSMNDRRLAKGYMYFRLGTGGVQCIKQTPDDICKYAHTLPEVVNDMLTRDIFKLIPGKDFLNLVQEGYITDYDGDVAGVYVDGFLSNLGLSCGDFNAGAFLLGEEMWADLCNQFDIQVNWANR